MSHPVNLHGLVPFDQVMDDDSAEGDLVRDMLLRAEAYITSFHWCPPVVERYCGIAIGGVIAVCLFKFEQVINGTDKWLWVVEGDVPSAYFVVDDAGDAASALTVYCSLMDGWVEAVENNLPLHDVFPVSAPATRENAEKLKSRVTFLRERILPTI